MKKCLHPLLCLGLLFGASIAARAELGKVAPGKPYETRSYAPGKNWTEKSYTGSSFAPSPKASRVGTGKAWEPRSSDHQLFMTGRPAPFKPSIYNPPEQESAPAKPYPAERPVPAKEYANSTEAAKAATIRANPADANIGTPYDTNIKHAQTKIYEARGKSITENNPMLRPMQDIRSHTETERTSTAVEGK